MSLDAWLAAAWQEHGERPEAVFARLPEAIAHANAAAELPQVAGLVVHVAGEHLGRWDAGRDLLRALVAKPAYDPASQAGRSVQRSIAVLARCAGDAEAEAEATRAGESGGDVPVASDRARILAIAAAALLGRGQVARALADLDAAVALAGAPAATDPAARALAITANNVASTLELRTERTPTETEAMLRAAATARRFWAIAGGWREVERAEYRLSAAHLAAGDADAALLHAEACQAIVVANGNDPGEAFFAWERVAWAQRARRDPAAATAARDAMAALLPAISDPGFRSFAADELRKFEAQT